MIAHLYDLRSEMEDADGSFVDAFAEDWRSCELSPKQKALLLYVEKLTDTPQKCTEEDIVALREQGWQEEAIFDAIQVCSYFNYINRIANGLGVDEEKWLDALGRKRAQ